MPLQVWNSFGHNWAVYRNYLIIMNWLAWKRENLIDKQIYGLAQSIATAGAAADNRTVAWLQQKNTSYND